MELGVSTACYFQKMMTEEAVVDIGAHGVKRCELFLNSFSEYETDYFSLLSDRIDGSGVEVYSVHPMSTQFEPQLFSIHTRQRNDAWGLYERVLRGAQRLRAKVYVMHGPVYLSGTAKNISLARIAPIFRDLSALAADYGITLALENVSWCVFRTPEFGRALRETLGAGALKYTLDVKQAIRAGGDPLAFVDAVGPDVVNVHLCDAVLDQDGRVTLRMPARGSFDFCSLYDALMRAGSGAQAFVEVYSDMYDGFDELYDSYARMRAVFDR